MSVTRSVVVALAGGLAHAGVVLAVALHLGYSVGPAAYSPFGVVWRYGGLVVVAAAPVWAAHRHRLVLPVLALVLTTASVLALEFTPPGPTFRDLATVERLADPTGIVVVEDGLYAVRYTVDATVWTVGFLFLGLVEHVVRSSVASLPASRSLSWLPVPSSRRRAAAVAAAGGLLHAAAMSWFAVRLGVSAGDLPDWLVILYGGVGMWLVAAGPLYLLLRRRLVAPAALLTLFGLFDAQAETTGGVEGPHALYFGAWVVPLAVLLVVAGVEYGLRRLAEDRHTAGG